MPNTFFISDTHFGHSNILLFKRDDGSPLRDFPSIEAHDEHIIECWNKTVRPCDIIYHLGDVVMKRKDLPILERLNGKKRLVMGNHDVHSIEYPKYFERLYGSKIMGDMILTHIPFHPIQLDRFAVIVHGHMHDRKIRSDSRYINVSCEQLNYTPVALEELRK